MLLSQSAGTRELRPNLHRADSESAKFIPSIIISVPPRVEPRFGDKDINVTRPSKVTSTALVHKSFLFVIRSNTLPACNAGVMHSKDVLDVTLAGTAAISPNWQKN